MVETPAAIFVALVAMVLFFLRNWAIRCHSRTRDDEQSDER